MGMWLARVNDSTANWRLISRNPARGIALLALMLSLFVPVALAGCAGASATPDATPLPVTQLPAQLAGRHIFVADLATGDLSALGARTLAVSLSIHGLGISSDHRWLYVSDIAGNRLVAYPLVNGALGDPSQMRAVRVGSQPVHMVNTLDDKRIFVTNFAGSAVSVVNASSWTLEKSINTPAQPHGIVLSPDGRFAYVACYGGAAIAVIDTSTATLARTIALPAGSEPYGIMVSADGRYIYASDNLTGRLFVVDTGDGDRVLPAATVGQHPALIARSPDGKTLYVTSGASRSLSVVSIANPAQPVMAASVNVGGYPHGVAVTPDGRYVVVATTTGKTLAVVDTKSNSVAATINMGMDPNDVLITG